MRRPAFSGSLSIVFEVFVLKTKPKVGTGNGGTGSRDWHWETGRIESGCETILDPAKMLERLGVGSGRLGYFVSL